MTYQENQPVLTPLGRALAKGITPDRKMILTVHRPQDLDLAKYGKDKPAACVFLFHPIESVKPLGSAA